MPLPPSFPDLASLDLFVSVVELGSVSRAAQAHRVAQPSASARLRHLERQLGLELLHRSPVGSTPTDAGVVIAGWAEATLRAAHELAAGLSAFKAVQKGRLRVAASFTIAEYLLPHWLGDFQHRHPSDIVALEVVNSSAVIARVLAGETDLGFIETPSSVSNLASEVVARDQLVTVVGRTHPWATLGSVPIEALAATPLVTREAGSGTREALEEALTKQGHRPPNSILELGSTAAVRGAVQSGTSPSVMSQLTVEDELEKGTLVRLDVPGLVIERELRAIWSQRKPLAPLAHSFLEASRGDDRPHQMG